MCTYEFIFIQSPQVSLCFYHTFLRKRNVDISKYVLSFFKSCMSKQDNYLSDDSL